MQWTRIGTVAALTAVIMLLAVSGVVLAQGPADPGQEQSGDPAPLVVVDSRFDSPRSTIETYLDSMKRAQELSGTARVQALNDAAACFDLSGGLTESGPELASDLLEILNRIGQFQTWRLPGSVTARDSGITQFSIVPKNGQWFKDFGGYENVREAAPGGRIILERDETGQWRFNQDTVKGLDEFHLAVERLPAVIGEGTLKLTPAKVVRSWMPPSLRSGTVLGVEYWTWIGLAIFIFAGIVLDYSIRFLIRRIWRQIMKRRGREADRALLKKAVRPFGLFASALLFYWTVRLLDLPPNALMVVLAAVRIFLMLSTVWAAFRVTDLLAEFLQSKAAGTSTKFDDLLVPLVRKTIKVLIFAVGLIYIAEAFQIEIMPLLTGLGIGGLAFAFAAKDTIENFFGSVAVIADRPFEVGDWVMIGDVEGTVEELGFRSTRIRTFYNSLVSVPNSTLVRATVDNYGRRRFRRLRTHLGLTYDTPPEKIEAFCEGIRELIRTHPYTRKDYFHVWLNNFGPSSLDVLLYMFHECPDWGTELRERQRIFLDILRLADHLGVQFAYPTQTLHVFNEESGGDHVPSDPPAKSAEIDARRDGIQAADAITADAPWRGSRPAPVVYKGRPPGTDGPLEAED